MEQELAQILSISRLKKLLKKFPEYTKRYLSEILVQIEG